jgi:hypothetical protein
MLFFRLPLFSSYRLFVVSVRDKNGISMQTYKIIGGDQKEYGPISSEQIRQWIKDGRLNAQTPAQREGAEWRHIGDYPEFADLFQAPGTAAPSGAPAAFPSAPIAGAPGGIPGGSREAALQAVKVPAILLIIVASIGIALFLLGSVGNFTGLNTAFQHNQTSNIPPETLARMQRFQGPVGGMLDLFLAAVNGFVLFGAVKMMRLQSRGLAMAACIVAMIPPNCCCILGLPFGIWGLVVINKPEVKSHFTG